ncbi:MAG: cytochrome b/b6 domain-containing protein [Pseudomonadales bacterium]
MTEANEHAATVPPKTLVWDWPLRIWHWAFALVVAGSLTTGLLGDISLMEWHLRLGYAAIGLLLFRIGWALWGGRYARLWSFRVSPGGLLAHFRGTAVRLPRTVPGAALALLMLLLVAAQAVSGLYTTDDIFTSGPLVRHGSPEVLSLMATVHYRLYWAVLFLVGVHLSAHVVYALRGDPTPLSMFTGRKRVATQPTRHLLVRGLLTAAAAAVAVWWGLASV